MSILFPGSLIFSGEGERRGPGNKVVVMWIELRNPTLNLPEFLDHSVDSIDENNIHMPSEKFGHCRKVLLRHFHLKSFQKFITPCIVQHNKQHQGSVQWPSLFQQSN